MLHKDSMITFCAIMGTYVSYGISRFSNTANAHRRMLINVVLFDDFGGLCAKCIPECSINDRFYKVLGKGFSNVANAYFPYCFLVLLWCGLNARAPPRAHRARARVAKVQYPRGGLLRAWSPRPVWSTVKKSLISKGGVLLPGGVISNIGDLLTWGSMNSGN